MAEHPAEVAEITRSSHALALNLGNITDARMKSMPESLKIAASLHTVSYTHLTLPTIA